MPGAWSADDKTGGWSAERQGQKGPERGALFTPGPLPKVYERGDYHGILHLRIKFSLFQVKVTVFDLLLLMYSYASNKY